MELVRNCAVNAFTTGAGDGMIANATECREMIAPPGDRKVVTSAGTIDSPTGKPTDVERARVPAQTAPNKESLRPGREESNSFWNQVHQNTPARNRRTHNLRLEPASFRHGARAAVTMREVTARPLERTTTLAVSASPNFAEGHLPSTLPRRRARPCCGTLVCRIPLRAGR